MHKKSMKKESNDCKDKQNSLPPSLQLIDPFTCLISNISNTITHEIVQTHHLRHQQIFNGYIVKLSMLNSLKRSLDEIGIYLPDLPNIAFKMFKPPNINGKNDNKSKGQIYLAGWQLADHQKKTATRFVRGWRRMILADDSMMGKTVTALACINLAKIKKILVICPKILIKFWWQHIKTLSNTEKSFNKIENLVKVLDEGEQQDLQKKQSKQQDPTSSFMSSSRRNSEIDFQYSILSYQSLVKIVNKKQINTLKFSVKHYAGVIIDEPFRQNFQTLMPLRTIQNLIILKGSITLQQSRQWLPILNNRVQVRQIQCRYGMPSENIRNRQQFKSAVIQYYFIKNSKKQYRKVQTFKDIGIEKQTMPEQIFQYISYIFKKMMEKKDRKMMKLMLVCENQVMQKSIDKFIHEQKRCQKLKEYLPIIVEKQFKKNVLNSITELKQIFSVILIKDSIGNHDQQIYILLDILKVEISVLRLSQFQTPQKIQYKQEWFLNHNDKISQFLKQSSNSKEIKQKQEQLSLKDQKQIPKIKFILKDKDKVENEKISVKHRPKKSIMNKKMIPIAIQLSDQSNSLIFTDKKKKNNQSCPIQSKNMSNYVQKKTIFEIQNEKQVPIYQQIVQNNNICLNQPHYQANSPKYNHFQYQRVPFDQRIQQTQKRFKIIIKKGSCMWPKRLNQKEEEKLQNNKFINEKYMQESSQKIKSKSISVLKVKLIPNQSKMKI